MSNTSKRRCLINTWLWSFFLVLLPSLVEAQSLQDYLEDIEFEEYRKNYSSALKTLDLAQQKYPQAAVLYSKEGDLLVSQTLYKLALPAYIKAEEIEPQDFLYKKKLAEIYAILNNYEQAIRYQKLLLDSIYKTKELYQDLAWLYFKTHQQERAIELLNLAPSHFWDSRTAMIMAIIYASVYNKEMATKYYVQSIKLLEESAHNNNTLLSDSISLIYYNFSLLEQRFYNFEKALEYVNASIDSKRNNSSSHLLKGELYLTKRDFEQAQAAFTTAEKNKDESPYVYYDLAKFYIQFGMFEQAYPYIKMIEEKYMENFSWMVYYGTDLTEFKKEFAELKKEFYLGYSNQLGYRLSPNLRSWWQQKRLLLASRFKQLYYSVSYSLLELKLGSNKMEHNNYLDAYSNLYFGSFRTKWAKRVFLKKAEELELALIPEAKSYYDLEWKRLDHKLIAAADSSYADFDPKWNKQAIEDSLVLDIKKLHFWQKAQGQELSRKLFAINPGAFLQNRLELPVNLDIKGAKKHSVFLEAKIKRLLKKAGFSIVDSKNEAPAYILNIQLARGEAPGVLTSKWYLLDPNGSALSSSSFTISKLKRAAIVPFINDISRRVFTAR